MTVTVCHAARIPQVFALCGLWLLPHQAADLSDLSTHMTVCRVPCLDLVPQVLLCVLPEIELGVASGHMQAAAAGVSKRGHSAAICPEQHEQQQQHPYWEGMKEIFHHLLSVLVAALRHPVL